jgi:hypothetical protein
MTTAWKWLMDAGACTYVLPAAADVKCTSSCLANVPSTARGHAAPHPNQLKICQPAVCSASATPAFKRDSNWTSVNNSLCRHAPMHTGVVRTVRVVTGPFFNLAADMTPAPCVAACPHVAVQLGHVPRLAPPTTRAAQNPPAMPFRPTLVAWCLCSLLAA